MLPRSLRTWAALCLPILLVACGEPEPPAAEAVGGQGEVASSTSLSWGRNLTAAFREARKLDHLVLAYVFWDSSWCPACASLERRVFDRSESAAIGEACVPVMVSHEQFATAEEHAFARRYRVRVVPTLLILTPEGDVLHRQVGGLFPLSALGQEAHATTPELLGIGDLLSLLTEARRRDGADRARMAELTTRSDAASRIELSHIHRSRARWIEEISLLERAAAETPGVDVEEALIDALVESDRKREATARLHALLERDGAHAHAPLWRLRVLLLREGRSDETPTPDELKEQDSSLTAVVRRAARRGNTHLEATARLERAELFRRAGKMDWMREDLLWFDRGMSKRSPLRGLPAELLLRLILLQRTARATAAAKVSEEWLRRQYPNSVQYQYATHGVAAVPIPTADSLKPEPAAGLNARGSR